MSKRIRSIKPEWLDDERLAAASDEARVLSIALILVADDYGRGRAALANIAAEAWRYQLERDDGAHAPEVLARASRALRELVAMEYVVLYEVSGQRYFAIRNWAKHQRVDRPSKPRIPPPPEQADDAKTVEKSHADESLAEPSRDPRETVASESGDTRDRSGPGPGPGARIFARAPEAEPRDVASRAAGLSAIRGAAVDGQPLHDWLRAGVVRGYESLKKPAPRETRDPLWVGWRELEAWVLDKARLTGRDPRDVGRHHVRCFLRSPVAKRKGWPIAFLVANGNEFWTDDLPSEMPA